MPQSGLCECICNYYSDTLFICIKLLKLHAIHAHKLISSIHTQSNRKPQTVGRGWSGEEVRVKYIYEEQNTIYSSRTSHF